MKSLCTLALCSLLTVAAAFPAAAQTTPSVVDTNTVQTTTTIWDFLTTGSNYWACPFATFAPNSREFGGGMAVGFKVSDVVNPVLRLDYFASQLYLVSVNAQLQVPRSLLGKFPVTPFALGGVATGLGGLGTDNGTAIGIVGAGAYSGLDFVGSGWFWHHTKIIADYERWVGLPQAKCDQIRFGFLFSF